MRRIRLTNGKYATVDDDLYEELRQYTWFARQVGSTGKYYAFRREGNRQIPMHRQIMNAPDGMDVDHINNDGLQNQRSNLRLATHSENLRNRRKTRKNSTGYKGVSRQKGRRKFRAQIYVNCTTIYLGWFDKRRDAACAYDRAARKLHGEFARTNFKRVC